MPEGSKYKRPIIIPSSFSHIIHTKLISIYCIDTYQYHLSLNALLHILADSIMHFTAPALTFLSVLAPLAHAVTLSYDPGYSQGDRSLNVVSCSDGSNGLITRYGWSKQSDIPRFPYIGGSFDIAGWNSPSCGQCYSVEYAPTGKKVFILAIDHVAQGLNVAQKAMDELTNNQAVSGQQRSKSEECMLTDCYRSNLDALMSRRRKPDGRIALFRMRREASNSRHSLKNHYQQNLIASNVEWKAARHRVIAAYA
jgi:hypothetical protein